MKELEFIINGEKLEALKNVLDQFSNRGITLTSAMGYGHQHGLRQVYTRDDRQGVALLPKISVRTVVPDDEVDSLVDAVVNRLGTSSFGDGKIFVRNIEQAIRIRTNERDDDAL
ncbi:P-II family nitrogen regulator [Bifidobacterium choloepi]|uniref:P-II family nitrogen regulator n=1 Tax=Bifidobacterium choloepi TaxID=2614131 RepID=A0A6I5N4D2_9BIFI|nr:P-II family nitrogen regulator [Bifidobacterium choloepi]NEG70539.1 P-II family nitrogen regulator [Bifidobacterium choloepi]